MIDRLSVSSAIWALVLAGCGAASTGVSDPEDVPGSEGTEQPGDDDGDGLIGPGGDDGADNGDDGKPAPDGSGDTAEDPGDDTGDGTDASIPVRFVALGDGGRGSAEQYAVAAAMESVCAQKGCDFAIYAGDNIYSDGVSSVDDPQFEEKFEAPYRNLDFPFFMALGNHDWTQGETGANAQVEYTARSTKWTMPEKYYTETVGDLTLFALDTQPIRDGDVAPQEAWIQEAMANATTNWKIAFGHHPYVSNGEHGNTGGDFQSFFDANLCGKIDVYVAGHDHDLQWLQPQCGVEMVVSGGASSIRETGMGSNPTFFEASASGFMWVEIAGNTLTGTFYDADGNELYSRIVQK